MNKRGKIYQSRLHLAVTFILVVGPLLFLFFFSRLAHIATGSLLVDISFSLWRLLVAYIIAAFFGWLLAIAFYRGRRSNIALPFFDVLQSFPTFALLPLVTLFWGTSNVTVVAFLVVTIIWPVLFSTISSLKLINKDWKESAEIYGLGGYDYFRRFLLPISIPGVITGSVIGLGEGWEALVATEIIIGIQSGLGGFFQFYSTNPTITAFGILGLLLIIFSVNKLIWLPLMDRGHELMEE